MFSLIWLFYVLLQYNIIHFLEGNLLYFIKWYEINMILLILNKQEKQDQWK